MKVFNGLPNATNCNVLATFKIAASETLSKITKYLSWKKKIKNYAS